LQDLIERWKPKFEQLKDGRKSLLQVEKLFNRQDARGDEVKREGRGTEA
jgi:hypothetical protein